MEELMKVKSFDKFLEEMQKIDNKLITEDVKNELIEIFNGAVEMKAAEMKTELKNEMLTEAEELKTNMVTEAEELRDEIITEAMEFKEKLIDTIDSLLDESVNDFFEKYEENIEEDVKYVFYENFFNTVKAAYEKNNFQLNESDVDVISSLKKKLNEKDETLNEKTDLIFDLKRQLQIERGKIIFNERTSHMGDMEKAKFQNLIGEMEFADENDIAKKIDLFLEKFSDVEIENDDDSDISDISEIGIKVDEKINDDIVKKWAIQI